MGTDSLALAQLLRSIAARPVASKGDLAAWYEEARLIQEALKTPGIGGAVPRESWSTLWHYLSDADIRLRDPEYARIQNGFLSELVTKLEQASGVGSRP